MARGGPRPGSGRKKGSKALDKEMARERLRMKVWEHWDPLIEAQIANAKGIKYLVARHKASGKFIPLTEDAAKRIINGEDPAHEMVEVWEKDPSIHAFTDLMNRAIDRPAEQKQEVDVNLPGVEAVIARLLAGRKRVADAGGS